MATLDNCLEAAIATGRISQDMADAVLGRIERHTEQLQLSGGYSPDAAARMATDAALALQQREIRQLKRQRALQTLATHKAVQNVTAHPKGAGTGTASLLGRDLTRMANYSNVDRRSRAVLHELHRLFAEPMEALRTKNLGLTQDRATMRNLVLELFGENTGDVNAKVFADSWSKVAELARRRFNAAGGAIPKRKDWGMPQWHDPLLVTRAAGLSLAQRRGMSKAAVAAANRDAWINKVRPRLDRARMTGDDGMPLTDAQLDELLGRSYDRITTNGLVDLIPGQFAGSKLANRRQDARVLVFKSGQDWLDYADEFGRADLFATLTGHLESMSHDIALLEVLGPNPNMTYRVLRDLAKKDGTAGVKLSHLDALFNTVSGKVDDTASVRAADIAAAARNLLTSARLGSAALSAVSDINFIRQTAQWTDVPAMKVATRMLSLLNPTNAADRLVAVKLGLGADAWVTRALAANRFTEVTGAGMSAKVADFVMRVTGLSHWTDAGKKAFGMELASLVGEHAGRTLDQVPPLFRAELERYGFDADDWRLLTATDMLEHEGARFLSMDNLMARQDIPVSKRTELANKYLEMQAELGIFAVPEPDARTRAITTAGKGRGTLGGEGMRFVGQFKSFPVSVILSHFYRGVYEAGAGDRGHYLASMIIGTTIFGYVAMQAKEISKGREPRKFDPLENPLVSARTLGAAFMQGGGAGIYGDFIYSGMFGANRFGQNMLTSLAGPMSGLVFSDIPRMTTGQFGDVIEGRDPKLAADAINFMRNYAPGNSIWYTRLLTDRLIFDQLQLMSDPDARRKFRQSEARRFKDTGQRYWWRRGEAAPQ